jgi:ribosome biogenesis GTPase
VSEIDPEHDSPAARALTRYGWDAHWAARLAEHPGTVPGRVIRHDGVGLQLATADGVVLRMLGRRLDPAPTVGDWVVCAGEEPVAVLPRDSLLRRRAADADRDQSLAANVDVVFLVCGLDRPVKPGRVNRGATVALEAGATPVVVLTKAAVVDDPDRAALEIAAACPGVEVLVTSAREGVGLDALRDHTRDRTVTLLGESGAGKSSLVNALLGEQVADVGAVRAGDSKGRHTTTTRDMHLLPTGGVIIDTPGIRAVGLWAEPDDVSETFADVDALADECKFRDCAHDTEPGCAVTAAVDAGELSASRVEAWRALDDEVRTSVRSLPEHERRRYERSFARVVKDAQRRKGRDEP